MTYSPQYTRADVEILEQDWVFRGYFGVRQVILRHRKFDGSWSEAITRELFERGDAVAVLPYDVARDELILIEQFRPGALNDGGSPWMLELIAGVVEPDESDSEVAHREALEEAGCTLDKIELIASFYPSAGACTEQIRCFVGRVDSAPERGVFGLDEEHEDIKVHRVSCEQAFAMLHDNKVNNGHTLIALQWLALNHQALRKRWL
ncbi:NUDIX domain-containing protein [Aequoribacter sp.]|jgi:ADP-ribose pyrophosphatase|uniref:NUDIX domain-containing protein n=1 Tax=Aequoribacter sp. TaxID=2847771 RepID=UPI003C67D417